MDTSTDIPPVRMAHAGLRLAAAVALVPTVLWMLWIALTGVGSLVEHGWCGMPALSMKAGLLMAALYTSVILIPCAVILIRKRSHATALQRKLLGICAIGILLPALLAATALAAPAATCASPHQNKIPIG